MLLSAFMDGEVEDDMRGGWISPQQLSEEAASSV